jgi:RNA polymerase-binding transcription factor DksA
MDSVMFPKNVLVPIQNYLTSKEKQLKERKKSLQAEDPFSDPDRLNDNAAVDTEAAEQFGHERIEAIRREVDKALINVRKALTKIKLGKYGACEGCGKMIDTDRLAVDPTARFCMQCQKKKNAVIN